ncbi:unnamed protein product [Camellia sinensis]
MVGEATVKKHRPTTIQYHHHHHLLLSEVGEATVKKQRPTIQYNPTTIIIVIIISFSQKETYMNETSTRNEVVESAQTEAKLKDDPKQHRGSLETTAKTNIGDCKGVANVSQDAVQAHINASGEVNMEASISSDDVIRAGGFGARDDIGSFLPVASDSTDFEASLRDARDYEDPQEEICRPGLGFTKATN